MHLRKRVPVARQRRAASAIRRNPGRCQEGYQAMPDSKIDDLWVLVQNKYDRKLRPERLRPGDTGPKVSVAFDAT